MSEDTHRAETAMPGPDSGGEDRERFALDHVKTSLTEETAHSRRTSSGRWTTP